MASPEVMRDTDRRRLHGLSLGLVLLLMALSWLGAFDALDNAFIDMLMRHGSRRTTDPRVVLVYVTDHTRSAMGYPPSFPRAEIARYLKKVSDLGARVQLVDVLLGSNQASSAERDGELAIIDVARKVPDIVFDAMPRADFVNNRTVIEEPLPQARGAQNLSLAQSFRLSDGTSIARDFSLYQVYSASSSRLPLLAPEPSDPTPLAFLPHLAWEGARRLERVALGSPRRHSGLADGRPWYIASGGYVDLGSQRVWTFGANASVFLDFQRPLRPHDPANTSLYGADALFEMWTYEDLMRFSFSPGAHPFEGKVVMLGSQEQAGHDFFDTPLGQQDGPSINAQLLTSLIDNRFLLPVGEHVVLALCLVLWAVGTLLFARLSPVRSGLAAAVLALLVLGIGGALYHGNALWLRVCAPVASVAATWAAVTVLRARAADEERRFVRETFSRYAPHQVVDLLLADPRRLRLGGDSQEVTVLFADINGFTSITETMGPEQTIEMLNEYFARMTTVVFRHHGLIKQFVGDEIMVIFGAPIARDDHARLALAAAWEMREETSRLRAERESAGKPGFDLKFGVNSGRVVLGNIGSPQRVEYGAVGDVVNAASRIMGLTKEVSSVTRILVGQSTADLAGEQWDLAEMGTFSVRGKTQTVTVFELRGPQQPRG